MAGHRKPYTEIGIRRMRCFRCPNRAETQWNICSDGNVYRPLCLPCDVELNAAVLEFMRHPDREKLIAAYRAKKLGTR